MKSCSAVPSFRPSPAHGDLSLRSRREGQSDPSRAPEPRVNIEPRVAPVQGTRRSCRTARNQYPRRNATGPDQRDRHRSDEPVRHGPRKGALQAHRGKGRADDHAVLERGRSASASVWCSMPAAAWEQALEVAAGRRAVIQDRQSRKTSSSWSSSTTVRNFRSASRQIRKRSRTG